VAAFKHYLFLSFSLSLSQPHLQLRLAELFKEARTAVAVLITAVVMAEIKKILTLQRPDKKK